MWVGFDDYSDIRLSGAQTAAPIWAEFMKKAVTLPQYSDVKPFTQPEGVVDVQLDKITNRLATPTCPDDYTIAFVAGTEPRDTCDGAGGVQGFFSRIFGGNSKKALPPPGNGTRRLRAVSNPKKTPRRRKASLARLWGSSKEIVLLPRLTKMHLLRLRRLTTGRRHSKGGL